MCKDFQIACNLKSKPTTNSIESVNAAIKRCMNGEMGMNSFLEQLQAIVIDQEVNFLLARSGVGQFSLKDDYLNLKIEKHNILGKNIIEEIAKTRMKEKEINELELSNKFKDFMNSLSLPNALERILSIKTLNILKKRDSIFKRPGSNENQFVVEGSTKELYVVDFGETKNICNCKGFQQSLLCSHVLAVCEVNEEKYEKLQEVVKKNPPRYITTPGKKKIWKKISAKKEED